MADRARDSDNQSDIGLMRRVAEGDQRAQRVLAHRLASRIRRVTMRLLANAADADDAAQNALIEVLRSAGSYRQEASIERWADRIAVRTALRQAREQRRGPFQIGLQHFDGDDLGVHGVPRAQEHTPRPIAEYLKQLSQPRREVLVLKHALGYTAEEIAELTDKPVGTVKDRLVAARKQLRKLIARELRLGAKQAAKQASQDDPDRRTRQEPEDG